MNYNIVYNKLKKYWKKRNCIEVFSTSLPKGAATLDMYFLLGSVIFEEYNVMAQCESIRYIDSLGTSNNYRVCFHHQFEVILKPINNNAIKLFKKSLSFLFKKKSKNFYIEFIQDNWKHDMLGAYGVGYECRINGLEIAQITYFKAIGNIKLSIPLVEFAYGLERIFSLMNNTKKTLTKKNINHLLNFREKSLYNFINKNYNNLELIKQKKNELNYIMNDIDLNLKNENLYFAFKNILLFSDKFNLLNSIRYINNFDKQFMILKIQNRTEKLINQLIKNENKKK